MWAILQAAGRLDPALLAALTGDVLVADLLLAHGLHPDDIGTRLELALDALRPFLRAYGSQAELVEVTADRAVRVRLDTCTGPELVGAPPPFPDCPPGVAPLGFAVRTALQEAAPEATITVEEASGSRSAPRSFVGRWHRIAEAGDLPVGAVMRTVVAGTPLAVCLSSGHIFGFRDSCARCGGSLRNATLEKSHDTPVEPADLVGRAVLACPTCSTRYDVRRSGAGIDLPELSLDPLPVLVLEGSVLVAVNDARLG
jgi:nitrite reductase/ring-hydroxylating ferredoxin subunit